MQPARVEEFLLFDLAFPRSVALCVRDIHELALTLAAQIGQADARWAKGPLSALRAVARSAIDEVMATGLHEFLDRIQRHLIALTDELDAGRSAIAIDRGLCRYRSASGSATPLSTAAGGR
jgi:uncharacterized alpha-E superfamily protein